MKRRTFVKKLSGAGAMGLMPAFITTEPSNEPVTAPSDDRLYWARLLHKIASPVLEAMSKGMLKKTMPVETPEDAYDDRANVTHLEALGRTMAGVAPWLALPEIAGEEGALQKELTEHALQSIANAVDPSSPDCLNFTEGAQPLVDGAFLAHGLLRAPEALWEPLDAKTKTRLIKVFKRQRRAIKPYYSNWLLFGAMLDAFLFEVGEQGDLMRMDYAIKKHQEWYLGDGWYGDGPEFHFDYYNGYVIHPMLVQVLKTASKVDSSYEDGYREARQRRRRFARHQERLISPEGTYPPIGRSITYRIGAFQPLAEVALEEVPPEDVSFAQIRCALTAVMKKQFEAEGTFDDEGWLRIGFCGHQREMGDPYISTGSLYLCTVGFLPLGLSAEQPFWTDPAEDWTSKKAWNGQFVPK